MNLGLQALLAWWREELDQADVLAREALALAVRRTSFDVRSYPDYLEVCALIDAAKGQAAQAARLLGAAAAYREGIGLGRAMSLPTADAITLATASAEAALGEEAWAAALSAGRALSLEEAVAEARDASQETRPQAGTNPGTA